MNIRSRLMTLVDEDYRKFSSSLLPGKDNILGVRLPELRKIAKEISKSDYETYFRNAKDEYFEEIMLQGMVIGYLDLPIEEVLDLVANFVGKIDNWSVCDSFIAGLKITKKYKKEVWEFLESYFLSDKTYDNRFATVMALNYFLEDDYIDDTLTYLANMKSEDYYADMAIAWYLATAFIEYPDKIIDILKGQVFNEFIIKNTKQKIYDSRRVEEKRKDEIRFL